MIVVLAGGVGAARFLQGVVQVVPQEEITVIANTGDDREFYGLHVSPDVDIVMYTLAGLVNEAQGWGILGDTYNTMQQLTSYGNEDWFALGDRVVATHIHRTQLLRQGRTLSEITDGSFAARFIADQDAGGPEFAALRAKAEQHPIEEVGRQLRGLMSWVNVASDDDYVEGTAAR